MEYALENLDLIKEKFPNDYLRIVKKVDLDQDETQNWRTKATKMYFPYSEKHGVYLQQDGFMDKELIPVDQLPKSDRPINQKWSWDRILRSPYIKQADVLQGFYFFENDFDQDSHQKHFDFSGLHELQGLYLGHPR